MIRKNEREEATKIINIIGRTLIPGFSLSEITTDACMEALEKAGYIEQSTLEEAEEMREYYLNNQTIYIEGNRIRIFYGKNRQRKHTIKKGLMTIQDMNKICILFRLVINERDKKIKKMKDEQLEEEKEDYFRNTR